MLLSPARFRVTAIASRGKSGDHQVVPTFLSHYWQSLQSASVAHPHDAVGADVIEQEEPGAERLAALLRVPHEEPAGEVAAGDFDAAVLVGEKHEQSRSLANRVVFRRSTVTRLPNSPGTRHSPVTPSPK